jgi:hypothetical protein
MPILFAIKPATRDALFLRPTQAGKQCKSAKADMREIGSNLELEWQIQKAIVKDAKVQIPRPCEQTQDTITQVQRPKDHQETAG